uniref:Uncharacterized protein n=1 Tax=Aegilops tauschii TaxID=37682 RepID=M8CGX5_AEGTA
MPACCAAAVSPAFGFPRIRRKALFPGLTGRRHPLGSPADAVEGRYVGGLHPPQAAPPYVPHLDGSCPLPPAARRWDLSAARPRAATVQEGDIAVRALLELGRGTVQTCEILVLQYSPGLYEYTGKIIDEFGVTDLKIYLNEILIWNLPKEYCVKNRFRRTVAAVDVPRGKVRSRQKLEAIKNRLTGVLGTDGGDEMHQQKLQAVAVSGKIGTTPQGTGELRFGEKLDKPDVGSIYGGGSARGARFEPNPPRIWIGIDLQEEHV